MNKSKDFLHAIVENDLKAGKYKEVVTRFPPEPNGFPHIGHAKSIYINFGIAKDFNGKCNLRMDDTDPTKEDTVYVEALKDAVKWLGFSWDKKVYYTSDYFPKLYEYAKKLIKMGKAYVDSLNEDEIKEYRGTVTSAGKRSKYADRSIEENLDLFERMRRGEFKDGEHILRAKIDMSASNMKMRDPLLYRIRHAHHFRTKDEWCIYPMYDFAHPLSDYIEGVTHSICTLEFENNRELYDWILDTLELKPPRPYQYEFARLDMNYTVMSKRKLLELVEKKVVNGWDDPRMPTVAGLRRRGYTPESVLNFCEQIGVAKANSVVDVSQLEFCIRDDLNKKAPRVMCVLNPLKVTITNYEGSEDIEASYYPKDVAKEGSRKVPFSKTLYIDKDDFEENPPKGYYRLTPTQPVRLKHAYIISCEEVIKDKEGNIIEIKARYYPESKSGQDKSGIKVKSAIQWVSQKEAKKAEVRVYDRLFKSEAPKGIEDINPNSLKIIKNAFVEPAVINEKSHKRFQFEREGYFYKDPIDYSEENPVFNKIVGLKDSWSKKNKKAPKQPVTKKEVKKPQVDGEVAPMRKEEQKLFEHYTNDLKLNSEIANTLARDKQLSKLFKEVLSMVNAPVCAANIIANEVARELKVSEALNFGAKEIAELVQMLEDETISTKISKQVFEEMIKTQKNPKEIVKEKDLVQISDPKKLEPIIEQIISKFPENVAKYKEGNEKLFGFFVGQVLKATNSKANPKVINELISIKLRS